MQTMLVARRILIFVALWLLFEGVISLLATCDQVAETASQQGGYEQTKKHCSALSGPVFASGWAFLYWLGHVLEGYGEAVIAVFTIVLAFATGLLWKATRDLVRGSERTAERQLRAYVSIVATNLTSTTLNGPLSFMVQFKNSGQTPAFDLTAWIGVGLHALPLEAPLKPPPEKTGFTTTLGPGSDSFLKVTRKAALTSKDWSDIKGGKRAVYVFGQIDYIDAFGVQRFTKFCVTYSGESDSLTGLKRYQTGNEAT